MKWPNSANQAPWRNDWQVYPPSPLGPYALTLFQNISIGYFDEEVKIKRLRKKTVYENTGCSHLVTSSQEYGKINTVHLDKYTALG